MRSESLDFFRKIVNAPSPSGYEERAAEVYREYTKPFADEVKTDVHGNVWAILNPNAKTKIMLAGHMDEIGFLVHHITDEGLLKVKGIGGHDLAVPVGQRVRVFGKEEVIGVIGAKPIHSLSPEERSKKSKMEDLWIDIGAKDKEEAEKLIPIGSPAVYLWEWQELLGDRVTARGFDDKMGSFIVAEALRLIKESGDLDPNVGVIAVATVQEEIGLRGATTAAFGSGAQCGLAVDVDFATDYPGMSHDKMSKRTTDEGPTVLRGANINPIVFDLLEKAAEKAEIPIQVTAEPGGTGTDANAMQTSRSGMAVGLLGVPLRYMHTPCETLALKDVEGCAELMAGFCRLITPETDFTPRLGL